MIFLLGCVADGNVLVALDDRSVWTDEGDAYEALAVINPVDFGRAGPSGRLRRIEQAVTIGGSATVEITPYGDGDPYDDQAVSTVLVPADGSTQIVEANVAVQAQRFQYAMRASGFDGPVEFGGADLQMIPRRSGR